MADFTGEGWSIAIAVIVIVSIAACALLAWSLASRRAPVQSDGTVGSTGHVWDEDLYELNNPLPRWWLYLFYITCVFAAGYLYLYPGLGKFSGSLDWTSAGQYQQEVADAKAVHEPLFNQYLAQPVAEVAKDPRAVAMGERLYLTYCTQCHGSDARGSRSFPNLADADWLGAGDAQYIKNTISQGRVAVMPPMRAAIGGTGADVAAVANYVLSLSGASHVPELVAPGREKFVVCAACHGAKGAGNSAVGAPNLTDNIWLYGGSKSSVKAAIEQGFENRMPPFGNILGDGKVHVLAAYVMSLSQAGSSDE